jgi:hypothetical protein
MKSCKLLNNIWEYILHFIMNTPYGLYDGMMEDIHYKKPRKWNIWRFRLAQKDLKRREKRWITYK